MTTDQIKDIINSHKLKPITDVEFLSALCTQIEENIKKSLKEENNK